MIDFSILYGDIPHSLSTFFVTSKQHFCYFMSYQRHCKRQFRPYGIVFSLCTRFRRKTAQIAPFSGLFITFAPLLPVFPSVARFFALYAVFPCSPGSRLAFRPFFLLWPDFPPSAAFFLAFRVSALLYAPFPFCDPVFCPLRRFPCSPGSALLCACFPFYGLIFRSLWRFPLLHLPQ